VNLNPFLRYDGYWILSDLVKIPNLKNKSDLILIDVYKKIINGNKVTFTKSKTFLFIYGIISNFFIFIFLFFFLFNDPFGILYFPIDFYRYSINVFDNKIELKMNQFSQFVLPAIFYLILFKLIWAKFKTTK
jgi:putative peptide zinc metalloprotease protein